MVKKYLSSAANLNENGDRELFGYTRRKRIGMPCRWFNLCVNLKRYKKRKQNKSKAKGEKTEKQRRRSRKQRSMTNEIVGKRELVVDAP